MSFTDVWNTAYEGIPADSENINLGANRIRDFKVNTRQRGGVDHSWGDTTDNGQHNRVTFNQAAADPATVAATGYLYTKAVAGNPELFYKDAGGRVQQLTSVGSINLAPTFPSGTVMSFLQATPPAGWTQSGAWNDGLIRLVNDASGGAVGGSWTISGVLVSVAGETLSLDQLPFHTHDMYAEKVLIGAVQSGAGTNVLTTTVNVSDITFLGPSNGPTGFVGNAHTHGASFSNDSSWRPSYVNACVGVKT